MRRLQPLRQQYETLKTVCWGTATRRLETIRDSLKHSADFAIDDTPMEHAPALANIEEPLVEPTAQADAMETSSDYEEWFMANGMPAEPINYDQYRYLLDD